jgi:hypothetical protein
LIDKLILFIRTRFGGIKYTKKAILCQGILAQDLGFILGAFSEGIRGILEAHPTTAVPPAQYS